MAQDPPKEHPKASRVIDGRTYYEHVKSDGTRFTGIRNANIGGPDFVSHAEYDKAAEGLSKLSSEDRKILRVMHQYDSISISDRKKLEELSVERRKQEGKPIHPYGEMKPEERKAFDERLNKAGVSTDRNTLSVNRDMANGGIDRKHLVLSINGHPSREDLVSKFSINYFDPASRKPATPSPAATTSAHARPTRGFATVAMMATTAALTAIAIPALRHLGVDMKPEEPAIRMTSLSQAASGLDASEPARTHVSMDAGIGAGIGQAAVLRAKPPGSSGPN